MASTTTDAPTPDMRHCKSVPAALARARSTYIISPAPKLRKLGKTDVTMPLPDGAPPISSEVADGPNHAAPLHGRAAIVVRVQRACVHPFNLAFARLQV